MKKYLFIAIFILATVCVCLGYMLQEKNTEYSRLRHNQEALLGEVQMYQTEAGKSAASVLELQLSYNELQRYYQDKCQQVEDLGLKVKRLESMSYTGTHTHIEAQAKVRDSIVYQVRDSTVYVDTLKWFTWRDPPWVVVNGTMNNGTVDLDIHSTDTLIQIVHRVPKKFLFFKFGTKAIRQEIDSMNPHTKLTYAEYIRLKR